MEDGQETKKQVHTRDPESLRDKESRVRVNTQSRLWRRSAVVLDLSVLVEAGRRTRLGQDACAEDGRQFVSENWKRARTLASEIT